MIKYAKGDFEQRDADGCTMHRLADEDAVIMEQLQDELIAIATKGKVERGVQP